MRRYRMLIAVSLLLSIAIPASAGTTTGTSSNWNLNLGPSGGQVYGGIAGVAAVITVGTVYFVHRSHNSLSGCVQQGDIGPTLTTPSGEKYTLVDAPASLKTGDRVSLRGHKINGQAFSKGHAFKVTRIARDHGPCGIS